MLQIYKSERRGKSMKKKILFVSVLAVVMLVGISFATAVNPSTTSNNKKKESPLFKIRTRHALGEKLIEMLKNFITKFLGERRFFLPFQWLKNRGDMSLWERLRLKEPSVMCGPTSHPIPCPK
jgi:hypothetical protein